MNEQIAKIITPFLLFSTTKKYSHHPHFRFHYSFSHRFRTSSFVLLAQKSALLFYQKTNLRDYFHVFCANRLCWGNSYKKSRNPFSFLLL